MQKFLLPLIATISFSLDACAGTSHISTPPPDPTTVKADIPAAPTDTPPSHPDASPTLPTPSTATNPVSIENISLTLPGADWRQVLASKDSAGATKVFWASSSQNIMMAMTKEPFVGNTQMLAMLFLKGISEKGATLVSMKEVDINSRHMVLINSFTPQVNVSSVLSVVDGNAYNLSCGTPLKNPTVESVCQGIIQSLHIQ
jgi:hypothetical protein